MQNHQHRRWFRSFLTDPGPIQDSSLDTYRYGVNATHHVPEYLRGIVVSEEDLDKEEGNDDGGCEKDDQDENTNVDTDRSRPPETRSE